jgi:hypothetical protein
MKPGRNFWLTFVFLATVAFTAWSFSCAGGDDDDDDDDGAGVDCTIENVCQWAVQSCGEYADSAACLAVAETCAEGVVDCVCDCMNADPACSGDGTGACTSQCQLQFCAAA